MTKEIARRLEGPLFACELGCRRICIADDSLGVIRNVDEGSPDLSHLGSILQDIFSYATRFPSIDCTYVLR